MRWPCRLLHPISRNTRPGRMPRAITRLAENVPCGLSPAPGTRCPVLLRSGGAPSLPGRRGPQELRGGPPAVRASASGRHRLPGWRAPALAAACDEPWRRWPVHRRRQRASSGRIHGGASAIPAVAAVAAAGQVPQVLVNVPVLPAVRVTRRPVVPRARCPGPHRRAARAGSHRATATTTKPR
jgi:hypothetical protein